MFLSLLVQRLPFIVSFEFHCNIFYPNFAIIPYCNCFAEYSAHIPLTISYIIIKVFLVFTLHRWKKNIPTKIQHLNELYNGIFLESRETEFQMKTQTINGCMKISWMEKGATWSQFRKNHQNQTWSNIFEVTPRHTVLYGFNNVSCIYKTSWRLYEWIWKTFKAAVRALMCLAFTWNWRLWRFQFDSSSSTSSYSALDVLLLSKKSYLLGTKKTADKLSKSWSLLIKQNINILSWLRLFVW